MQQHFPMFTATPHGIMMNGSPLTKSTSHTLPLQTLRYIKRAEVLLAKVKKEDWDNHTPHAVNKVPIIAQAQILAALASPQPFSSVNSKPLGKAGFDSSEPRDANGCWTSGGNGQGGEYQVAQRTDVATDAAPATNQASVTVHSRTNITISNPDGSAETRTGGSASWRNNNASNVISGDFADNHGAIGDNHGFAVFPDEATGDAASAALLRTGTYAGLTIDGAIARRSPPEENDTKKVQQNVREIGDFNGDEVVGQLNDEQMSRLVNAIKRSEGYHEGTLDTQASTRGN